ncbi:uncharacterized protein [Coffea arabica]|uniref:OVATE domain-containing protein n=1 Tax=Coffea arabica TaxID=13443 RepID=A0A6P6XFU3_COFAR
MLLRRSLRKTRYIFQKTLRKLKSFLFGRYQKLPKAPFINPFFSGSNSCRKMQELDDFYREFSDQWGNLDTCTLPPRVPMVEDVECGENHTRATVQIIVDNTEIKARKEEKMVFKRHERKREEACGHTDNAGSQSLAQKMKDLDMFELNDVDHQLDVEEVLHYYSRLTCPAYLDIVDKFFMDMYSEFVLPQPSLSVNSSMRRLQPVKL